MSKNKNAKKANKKVVAKPAKKLVKAVVSAKPEKKVKAKEVKKVLIFVKEPVSFTINRVEVKSEPIKREVVVEANALEVEESQAESFRALIRNSYGEDMIV